VAVPMIAKSTLFQLAKTLDGLPVLGCLPGTPAARAGVRYGDILLSVNGQRTRTFGDYIEAKALRSDGMHVVLFRQGEEHPVAFEYVANRGPVDTMSMLAELVSMRVLAGDLTEDGSGPVS
jgi:S1-C subfamily serine protease